MKAEQQLAQYMHNTRTAFGVYQGTVYLWKQGAASSQQRQASAERLIETLRHTERLS